jgi:hypothetical protein
MRRLQGRYLLVRVGGFGRLEEGSTERVSVAGEISLLVGPGDASILPVKLLRLGLYAGTPASWRGSIAKVTASAFTGEGQIRAADAIGLRIELEIQATLSFQPLQRGMVPFDAERGVFLAPREPFGGALRGLLAPRPEATPNRLLLLSGELLLLPHGSEGGRLSYFSVDLAGSEIEVLDFPPALDDADALASGYGRQLTLQPVQFVDDNGGGTPTGTSSQAQLDDANEVWNKCCIALVSLPMRTVPSTALRFETDPVTLSKSAGSVPGKALLLFFSDDSLRGDGGGLTHYPGMGCDVIILTSNTGRNRYLLAHEIGHALNGLHPRSGPPHATGRGQPWVAERCTVLEPSQPGQPNPSVNTQFNCANAWSPVIGSTGFLCTLNPDQPPARC